MALRDPAPALPAGLLRVVSRDTIWPGQRALHMRRMKELVIEYMEPVRLLEAGASAQAVRSERCKAQSLSCSSGTAAGRPARSPIPADQRNSRHAALSESPLASMMRILLDATTSSLLDYSAFIEGCRGLRLRIFHLKHFINLKSALELFATGAAGAWRMELDHWWKIGCIGRISIAHEPRTAQCLGRLSTLTASIALVTQLHAVDNWDWSLPMLRELMIQLIHTSHVDQVPALRMTATPICAPLLDSIALWAHVLTPHVQDWVERRLPNMLPGLLNCAFASILLDIEFQDKLGGCNLAPLAAVPKRIPLKDPSLGTTTLLMGTDHIFG
ncbi:hypothetical protein AURDEDRAFT_126214 [Auricularia subglabra TFB-10046 SS5]|nr:hypothetical protein AURDEDRAFT_126214 [Auricularia subglabra TFB-10046 SS5]